MQRISSITQCRGFNNVWLLALTALILSACDGAVQLCGQYACVAYQSDDDCLDSGNCQRERFCESPSSIRDRAPRIIDELRRAQRACTTNTNNIQTIATNPTPLTWDSELASISVSHARDMATNNFESFVGSDGLSTADRVAALNTDFLSVAESIGVGPQTTAEIINYWLDIGTDCQQLLDLQSTRIGMACEASQEAGKGPYWSILLARPEP